MANEATLSNSLRFTGQGYSRQSSFQMDVGSPLQGPTPGAFLVATDGTDVDLSELGQPSLAWMQNNDENNWIKLGRWDPDQEIFYPFLRLPPCDSNGRPRGFVVPLDYLVTEEFTGTSTGTLSTASTLRAIAENSPAWLTVEAFEGSS